MSQPKFTPGPWTAERDSEEVDSSGNGYFQIVPTVFHYQRNYLCASGWMSPENAHLLAAAPEMYEALEACEDYFFAREDADHNGERYVPNEEMKLLMEVRAALAKSEGRRS